MLRDSLGVAQKAVGRPHTLGLVPMYKCALRDFERRQSCGIPMCRRGVCDTLRGEIYRLAGYRICALYVLHNFKLLKTGNFQHASAYNIVTLNN